MRRLLVLILLGSTALTSEAFAGQGKMQDFDGDGREEALVYYEKNVPVKAVLDRDEDGFVEMALYYKNGLRDHAEIDLDKDGRTDQWIHYAASGDTWKTSYDFDHDGRPDYWAYSKNGIIYKWEQDRNGDGRPDLRTYYEGVSDRLHPGHFRQTYDNDFDGEFESRSGLTSSKRETRIPHSLAEALLS